MTSASPRIDGQAPGSSERAQALFDAARRDGPTNELWARTLEAARRARAIGTVNRSDSGHSPAPVSLGVARRVKYAVLAVAAALASFVLVNAWRRDPAPLAIGPERVTVRQSPLPVSTEPAPSPTQPEAHSQAPSTHSAPLAATRRSTSPTAVSNAAVPRAPASLSEEVAALNHARGALSKGDAASALSALDEYEHVLRGTHLSEEATLLRVEALARSGQRDAATAIARNFIETHPGSPLAERARSFVDSKGISRVAKGDGGGVQ